MSAVDFETRSDQIQVMASRSGSIGIADLKAHLSEILRQVRRGATFTLLDRKTPIARLAPYAGRAEPVPVRHALRPLSAIVLPRPTRPTDSLADLMAERNAQR